MCHVILRQPSWCAAFGERRLALVAKRAEVRIFIQLGCFGVKVCTATATGAEIFDAGRGSRGTVYYRMKAKKPRKTLALSPWLRAQILDMFGRLQQRFHLLQYSLSMVQLKKLFCWMLLGTNDLIEEGVTMVLHNDYCIYLKHIYYIIYI